MQRFVSASIAVLGLLSAAIVLCCLPVTVIASPASHCETGQAPSSDAVCCAAHTVGEEPVTAGVTKFTLGSLAEFSIQPARPLIAGDSSGSEELVHTTPSHASLIRLICVLQI